MNIKTARGGITAAKGFSCSTARAGFKKKGDDMALIYSRAPAVSDGMFTQSQVQAAPVVISKRHLKEDLMSQAVIINSGCANCCTGKRGLQDAEKMAALTAAALGIKKEDVLVASTGMIGTFLDMKKIEKAIPRLAKGLGAKNAAAAAKAIMTTDTVPKECAVKINISGKEVAIGAMAKGAGMIHPNMATMLCFITTDIAITRRALKIALEEAVNRSFNAVTVDGDTSTNDSVIIMANAAAGNRLIDKVDREFKLFSQALQLVTTELAKMIARDAEGATKFIEITVKNCPTHWQAVKVGRRLAVSPLLKTCIYGEDPNWGRVAAGLGTSGIRIKENAFDIYLGKVQVAKNGVSLGVAKERVKNIFKSKEVSITVDLKMGRETATVWTCDLTEGYIKINAEYET